MSELGEKQSKREIILDSVDNNAVESQEQDSPDEKIELVIFSMAQRYFACKGAGVREILHHTPITEVPGCPRIIRGIINVRGVVESVLDLHILLEMEDRSIPTKTRFILAQSEDVCSGIQVDSVEDVLSIESHRIKPVLSTLPAATKKYALGGGELYKEHYVVLLSIKKIFAEL